MVNKCTKISLGNQSHQSWIKINILKTYSVSIASAVIDPDYGDRAGIWNAGF
jgi:hypothetical protein